MILILEEAAPAAPPPTLPKPPRLSLLLLLHVCFRILSFFFFFFFASSLDTFFRPDLLEHMQCLGEIGIRSQRGTNGTVEGSKSRTCALLKCERQRRARTRHQEEEEGWCLVEERMLLSLPAVPARHPKLADQFLPGTAASSLSSGAGKRGDDDAKSCFCQASGPYQSSVQ